VLAVPVDVNADMQASQVDPSAGNFTLLAKHQTPAVLSTDAVGTQVQFDADADASEGSLVVDADGRLVGMVTMSDAGIYLVGVDSLMNAYNAASTATAVPAWLGVRVEISSAGDITVKWVLDGGPAATAGIQVGDVIRAVDGVAVSDLDSLRAAVTSHAAGEMVTLSILHPDTAQPVDVQVTLSQQPL